MNNVKTITWRKIEGAAKLAFNIYAAQSELKWAKQAWELLIEAGLATYSTETELYQVIIRFLALAGFYYKFYRVGWGGHLEPNYLEWAEELKLSAFHVRQLIKSDPYLIFREYHNFERYEDEDEYKLDSREINYLVNIVHKEVVAALLEGFGSEGEFWAIPRLFVSLWRSSFSEEEYQEYDYYEDHDTDGLAEEIVEIDNLALRKTIIFEWLTQECRSVPVQEVKAQEIQTSHQPYEKTNFENMKDGTSYPEYLFSAKTFELLSRWDADYRNSPMFPFAHTHYEELIEYIEKPFNRLCYLVAARLPAQLAAQPGDAKWEGTDLEKEFSPFKLLYIRINSNYLAFGYVIKTYRSLFLRSWQNNPEALAKVISGDPATFILPNNEILIPKNELIQIGIGELSDRIAQSFKKHIPMVLLATFERTNSAIADSAITDYLHSSVEEFEVNEEYTLWHCAYETDFDEAEISCWVRAIERKKQAIFQGVPGTGKTYIAECLAEHLISGSDGFSELIQFHPAYSYEDFIQGIRPQNQDGVLKYSLVPGRFLQFCKKAESRKGRCVLIIDEINRANLTQVFGELMYLLEYRDKKIRLAGSAELFGIPENVRIIGTMNTADRSIALVDHALRRRFAFIELRPNYEVLRRYHEKNKSGFQVDGLIDTLKRLNNAIADKHYEIGISFFLTENLAEELEDIWQMEIEPYLEEYFYDQLDKVDEFRWDKIKQQLCP